MYRLPHPVLMSIRAHTCLATAVFCLVSLSVQAGEVTNKLGIVMVDIPAGSFMMGSCKVTDAILKENERLSFLGQAPHPLKCGSDSSDIPDNETPQHRVTIKAFQIGKTELTLGQFKKYINATGNTSLINDEFMKYNAYGDDAPVVKVSWLDAQSFIKWLNESEGGGYRLPSEAEWEYACRAGDDSQIYCGANNIDDAGWYDSNGGGHQHPVGGKQANAWGLNDMSGNVWEWVQDCWHDNYSSAPKNGSAWTNSCSGGGRVLRGGSWNSNAKSVRATIRYLIVPSYRSHYNGFRLARDVKVKH